HSNPCETARTLDLALFPCRDPPRWIPRQSSCDPLDAQVLQARSGSEAKVIRRGGADGFPERSRSPSPSSPSPWSLQDFRPQGTYSFTDAPPPLDFPPGGAPVPDHGSGHRPLACHIVPRP